jgi:hypothetical protein
VTTKSDRERLLDAALGASLPLAELQAGLASFPWDSEPLVVLRRDHVVAALNKLVNGEWSAGDVEGPHQHRPGARRGSSRPVSLTRRWWSAYSVPPWKAAQAVPRTRSMPMAVSKIWTTLPRPASRRPWSRSSLVSHSTRRPRLIRPILLYGSRTHRAV